MTFKLKDVYFGVVLLFFILLIVVKWQEIKSIFVLFDAQDSLFLLLALLMQFFTYVVSALAYQSILHTTGIKVSFGFLFKSSFSMLSLNQIIPSLGFSGGAFFVSEVKKHGVSTGKGTLCIVLEAVIFYSSFILLMILSVLYLFIDHKVAYIQILLTAIFGVIVLLGVLYFFYIMKSKEKLSNFIYKIYRRVVKILKKKEDKKGFDFLVSEFFLGKEMMLHNKKKFMAPFIYSILKSVFDILTIYFVFLSFGYGMNIGVLTLGFCLATLLSYVSFIPGGIGVFEFSMAGIYAGFGVPFYLGFVSTLIFRGFSFWLPIPVGLLFYRTAK